jgi:hypothetical protein
MYIKKTYDMGRYKEVHKYYRYGCPRGKRGQRSGKTSDAVTRYNQKLKERQLQRLICANFREGDWHVVLSYRKEERPASMDAAKKDLRRFLRKIKRRYEKAGREFKYICVTERGKQGACHHHLIIQDFSDEGLNTKQAVMESWPAARHFTPLYDQAAFEVLAEYIAKKETKEDQSGCSYSRSRNLIVPKAKVRRILASEWAEEPRNEKGYEVIKATIETGENPYTGIPYMRYLLRKVDTPERVRKKQKKRSVQNE